MARQLTPESQMAALQEALLKEAERMRDTARAKFETSRPGTKAWRRAEEELNYWIGKVATLATDAGR